MPVQPSGSSLIVMTRTLGSDSANRRGDLGRRVGAAVVDDEDLQPRIGLGADGAEAVGERPLLVLRRDDGGDERRVGLGVARGRGREVVDEPLDDQDHDQPDRPDRGQRGVDDQEGPLGRGHAAPPEARSGIGSSNPASSCERGSARNPEASATTQNGLMSSSLGLIAQP